jgi:hypothetical protein
MAVPTLTPASQTSAVVLPETGSLANAETAANYPYGIYVGNTDFVSGAVDQVNYTYRKLGGDVLDIEITEKNVFASYEESVLEYSYIVNIHQAKNSMGSALGMITGTFDHDGQHKSDSPMINNPNVALKYPKFEFGYVKQIGDKTATEAGFGGTDSIYSASFDSVTGRQDYDLQYIIQSGSDNDASASYYGKVGNNRVTIRRVFYKTPHAMWRFYGYYGGINAIGNLSTYGMYADDSTFEVIPTWQNKLQAIAYEDAIYTRNSHYSYEVKNNKLRIFPIPGSYSPSKFWVEFTVKSDPYTEATGSVNTGIDGVNNMNTLPFANIPYNNINSIGKQWIRRFALSLSKETLGQVRGKFTTIPIPGNTVNLNATELLGQAKEEQEKLREELKTVLSEMTYAMVEAEQAGLVKSATEILQTIPFGVYVG